MIHHRSKWNGRVVPAGQLAMCLGLAMGLAALGSAASPRAVRAQTPPAPEVAAIDTTAEAGDADAVVPKRRLVKWNEYDGPISTLRLGYGFLIDWSSYSQDQNSKQQLRMMPDVGLRDFRLLLKGRFKTKRPITWTLGYMYDGGDKEWHFRQTGIQVDVPELSGRVFVGRTKEGFSQYKIMTGYYIWTMERSMSLDAFVPILADGIKWMGYAPRTRIFYSLGFFGDALSEDEKFATFDNQFVSRVGWQPILSAEKREVLHLAVMGREGHPDGGKLQVRSRPEAYLAPYFIDTGKITSDHAGALGVEACYQKGPWLYSSEWDWQHVDASGTASPTFQGGAIGVAWLATPGTRAYNAPGAFFDGVSPKRTVFEGGPGTWEPVLNFSYADFDDKSFHGGKFWRLTPMVKWHLSYNLRLELAYGYGKLDRFGLNGATHFYQARILTML